MKITKRQLRRIIKEEKARLVKEIQQVGSGGVFNADYMYDLIEEEIMAYTEDPESGLSEDEFGSVRTAVLEALNRLESDWVRQ